MNVLHVCFYRHRRTEEQDTTGLCVVYKKLVGRKKIVLKSLEEVLSFLLENKVDLPINMFTFIAGIDVKLVEDTDKYWDKDKCWAQVSFIHDLKCKETNKVFFTCRIFQ